MSERNSPYGHFGSGLILFALTTVMSILLLTTAAVVWLSELLGSLELAALLVAGVLGLISGILYYFSLREGFRQIGDRLETVYEVARAAREAYRYIRALLFGR